MRLILFEEAIDRPSSASFVDDLLEGNPSFSMKDDVKEEVFELRECTEKRDSRRVLFTTHNKDCQHMSERTGTRFERTYPHSSNVTDTKYITPL